MSVLRGEEVGKPEALNEASSVVDECYICGTSEFLDVHGCWLDLGDVCKATTNKFLTVYGY